jgi:hypothetical protein
MAFYQFLPIHPLYRTFFQHKSIAPVGFPNRAVVFPEATP